MRYLTFPLQKEMQDYIQKSRFTTNLQEGRLILQQEEIKALSLHSHAATLGRTENLISADHIIMSVINCILAHRNKAIIVSH